MHEGVRALFTRQTLERMNFCEFADQPINVEKAILELVSRFPGISPGQVMDLLLPWFPKYKVGMAIEIMVFHKKLSCGSRFDCLEISTP